jgi:hypothetical protein
MRLSIFTSRFFTTFPFIFPAENLEVSCILLERDYQALAYARANVEQPF